MADPNINKIKLYEAIVNMLWKSTFSLATLIAFFLVLYKLIHAETYLDAFKYTPTQLFLTKILYLAFKHYFPIKLK